MQDTVPTQVPEAPVANLAGPTTNTQITPTPEVAKPKKKGKGKLVLILGCLTLFLVTLLIAGSAGAVLLLNSYNTANSKPTNTTVSYTNNTNTTPVSSPVSLPVVDNTTIKTIYGIQIQFSEPTLTGTKALFRVNTKGPNYDPKYYAPISDYTIYKAGKVVSGKVGSVNVAGYDYNVAYTTTTTRFDGPGTPSPYLRYLQKSGENKLYLLEDYFIGDNDPKNDDFLQNFTPVSAFVKGAVVFDDQMPYNTLLKSSSENNYYVSPFLENLFTAYKGTKIDTTNDVEGSKDLYQSSTNKSVIYGKSVDGFTYFYMYFPSLLIRNSNDEVGTPIPQVTWSDGTKNTYAYDYISIGTCGDANSGLEVIDVTTNDLTKVGTDKDGNNVYTYKDPNNTYLKKLYNDDYVNAQVYKNNSIKADDTKPFDYTTYLKYHPLIIWQDPFGRFIRFASREFVMTGGCAKPAIYLYPTKPTNVHVEVIPNGSLTFELPKYNNGWDVTAYPDGKIVSDKNTYPYLWWESRKDGNLKYANDGFVVAKGDLEKFFNEKLSLIGLNTKESADFKDFWLTRMIAENKSYYQIHFLLNKDVDQIAKLSFDKKYDSLLRVFMVYKGIDSKVNIVEQKLSQFVRRGFAIVEWGGAEVN